MFHKLWLWLCSESATSVEPPPGPEHLMWRVEQLEARQRLLQGEINRLRLEQRAAQAKFESLRQAINKVASLKTENKSLFEEVFGNHWRK